MGILQCQVCKAQAEAENKDKAIELIDHAANSKTCNGKDENCNWYPKGIPEATPDEDIDPKRPIEGVTAKATVATKKTTASKKK